MTFQSSRPAIKARLLPRYPAAVSATAPIAASIANGTLSITYDSSPLADAAPVDPATARIVVREGTSYKESSVNDILGAAPSMAAMTVKSNLLSTSGAVTDNSVATLGYALGLSLCRADIPNYYIPVDAFYVAGYDTLGDGGEGALYVRGTSTGPNAIQDALGTWWNLFSPGYVRPEWFGAKSDWNGTTGTDNAPAWNAALAYLNSTGGGIFEARGDDYLTGDLIGLGSTVSRPELNSSIVVRFGNNARLVVATGFTKFALSFADGTKSQTFNVAFENVRIDASRGTVTGLFFSCTAINTYYLKNCTLTNVDLYGGTNPNNTNADSGHSDVGSYYIRMAGGRVVGFSDAGVYYGGDNIAADFGVDEGATAIVDGVLFQQCNNAATPKRELTDFKFVNCHVYKCNAGVVFSEINNGGILTSPPRHLVVNGCTFRQVLSNSVRVRGLGSAVINGNIFEDWCYDYQDNAFGSVCYALVFQGSQNAVVSNNRFACGVQFVTVASLQRAVSMDNVQLWGTTWVANGNHTFRDNAYVGVQYAYVEANSSGGVVTYLPSQYRGENINAAVAISSGLNPSSILEYSVNGGTTIVMPNQGLQLVGAFGIGAPVTKTADFTLAATENWIINNKAGSNCVVTLPAASSNPGRVISFKTIVAFAVVSASSNVIPKAGGAAGTAITGAVAGNSATIVSNGTNWEIMI